MELLIQKCWNGSTRKNQIENYISELSKELFEKSKTSDSLSDTTKFLINKEICKEYVTLLVGKYLNNIDYGSFVIYLNEKHVIALAKYASKQNLNVNDCHC